MLKRKDLNREAILGKSGKGGRARKKAYRNKENQPTRFSQLIENSAQKLVDIVLQDKLPLRGLFGVKDIQSIFVDKSDFSFAKKQTLTNAERSPSVKCKVPKKKTRKREILRLKKGSGRRVQKFVLFEEGERFSKKSRAFLGKRISQDFDNDMETDEDMAQEEVSIEMKLFLKAIKRHSSKGRFN